MPRLQILHHKSYHPYNEKNKARVREDEARAAEAELAKEQKRVEKDSEARLIELRRRAGSPSLQPKVEEEEEEEEEDDNLPSTSTSRDPDTIGQNLLEKHRKKKLREEKKERKQRERLDFDFPSETAKREKGKGKEVAKEDDGDERFRINRPEDGDAGEKYHDKSWDDHGHINFFRDIERDEKPRAPTLAEISKKKAAQEMDKFTMYLNRPERETKPWYTDPELRRVEEKATDEETERRRARDRRGDIRSKERNDPMTQVNALLKPTPAPRRHGPATPSDPQAARIQREQSERQRAMALIAKSRAVPKTNGFWEDTPSTVAHPGGSFAEDLERRKDRASNRFWDEERERDRVRGWERGVRGDRGGRSWEV